jgi:phosphoserine phosphatase
VTNAVSSKLMTTTEFQQAVLSMEPRVAAFDCDGTLWSGDAGSGFMKWTIEQGLLSREAIAWLDQRYQGYKRGEVSEVAICGEMVQVYRGLREDEIRAAAREFFEGHIAPNIFPEMLALVEALQAQGTEIWAVSSTNDWVIEEGVKRFGISHSRVLSARVASIDGLVTGQLLDVPTDEGKVASLKRAGVAAPDVVFGNSVHDAAMLAMAARAFPVNPTAALIEYSERVGWPVYYPESVRPRAAIVPS